MLNSELKCVWEMGTACFGKIQEMEFFNSAIKIPVCEAHIEEHKHVMILYKNDYDIEEILQQSPEYRKNEILILKLSDLDKSNIDL